MGRDEFDMASYFELSQSRCFVCAFLHGDPDYRHTTLFDDGEFVAFLNRYPTLRGQALVVPRRHVEHVLTDLAEDEYGRLLAVVRRVDMYHGVLTYAPGEEEELARLITAALV